MVSSWLRESSETRRQVRKKAAPVTKQAAESLAKPVALSQCYGIPNLILRSSLFGIEQRGEKRAYHKNVKMASVDGVNIVYTGETLYQSDLDVWEHCLRLARTGGGFGREVRFGLKEFLRAIGRKTGGKDFDWLKASLSRLQGAIVKIEDAKTKRGYRGQLLQGWKWSEDEDSHVLGINKDLASLYAVGWTEIDRDQRKALGRNEGAKWLHAYLSTNNHSHDYTIAKLMYLCGSKQRDVRKFLYKIKKPISLIEEITGWSLNIKNCVLRVDKHP